MKISCFTLAMVVGLICLCIYFIALEDKKRSGVSGVIEEVQKTKIVPPLESEQAFPKKGVSDGGKYSKIVAKISTYLPSVDGILDFIKMLGTDPRLVPKDKVKEMSKKFPPQIVFVVIVVVVGVIFPEVVVFPVAVLGFFAAIGYIVQEASKGENLFFAFLIAMAFLWVVLLVCGVFVYLHTLLGGNCFSHNSGTPYHESDEFLMSKEGQRFVNKEIYKMMKKEEQRRKE